MRKCCAASTRRTWALSAYRVLGGRRRHDGDEGGHIVRCGGAFFQFSSEKRGPTTLFLSSLLLRTGALHNSEGEREPNHHNDTKVKVETPTHSRLAGHLPDCVLLSTHHYSAHRNDFVPSPDYSNLLKQS